MVGRLPSIASAIESGLFEGFIRTGVTRRGDFGIRCVWLGLGHATN